MKVCSKKNWLFFFIILSGIILRLGYANNQLAVLFNDNAKNAWVATHFWDNFGWQTLLNIPSNLEIFFWSVLFKVFGSTALSYNLLGIIQFVLLICFFYLSLEKISGRKVAIIASLFLAFSPPIFSLDNLFFPGHSRGVMFFWMILFVFYSICEKPTLKRYLLLGFFGGMACAIGKIIPVITLFSCVIILFWVDSTFWRSKKIVSFILIFVISFLLFFNFGNPPELLFYNSLTKINLYNFNLHFFNKLFHIFKSSLLVSGTNLTYLIKIGFQNKSLKIIYGIVFLLSVPLWIYIRRLELKKFIIFPLYLLIFFIVFTLSPASEKISRYYLSVIPIYLYFFSDALLAMAEKIKDFSKIIPIGLAISFLGFTLFNNLHFYPSPYKEIFKVIEFAEDNNIKAIYTDYNLQFALVFHSKEAIAASSRVCPIYRGSVFDNIVESAPEISYLFEGYQREELGKYLDRTKISYLRENFGRLALYYNFSQRLSPSTYEKSL